MYSVFFVLFSVFCILYFLGLLVHILYSLFCVLYSMYSVFRIHGSVMYYNSDPPLTDLPQILIVGPGKTATKMF